MTLVRYELRSAAELDALARAPLPLGIHAGEARASSHRDLYLDTADDALRTRDIICRLRIGARSPQRLTLIVGSDDAAERVESAVRA
jgi:inorganic triphosphatase YgiF